MSGIDVVITWVDGGDPAHAAKRAAYGTADIHNALDKAASTRFSSLGEICWCVASINRFAPWVDRIFIVTDEQDPRLDGFMKTNFPEGYIPMEIVDHKVIFRGYEEYLPTFNSISIESMTWRIPGLSDRFIEFNDDLMLLKPVSPEDFFTDDGKVICHAGRSLIWWDRFTRLFKSSKGGSKKVTTKGSHMNGAVQAGHRMWYLRLAHCQKALRRDFYEKYYTAHPDVLRKNISFRFRDAEQFTSQSLQCVSLYDEGRCELRSSRNELFFLQPKKRKGYFADKMRLLDAFEGRFACFNSIDMASEEERHMLEEWIMNRLDIKLDR